MFRYARLTRPGTHSLLGAGLCAVMIGLASLSSPWVGYLLALLCLVMLVLAERTGSIWPTEKRPERPVVFALFWGGMLGLILPFLLEAALTAH